MPRTKKHAAPGEGHAESERAGKADPHALLHPDANVSVHLLTAGRVMTHGGAERRPPVMRDGALDASRLPSGGWLSRTPEPRAVTLIPLSGDPQPLKVAAGQRFWPVPSQPQPAPASPSQPQPAPASEGPAAQAQGGLCRRCAALAEARRLALLFHLTPPDLEDITA